MPERISRIAEVDEPASNPNAWMFSFADLCTLLLTFFVLLFSMSSLNERAFRNTFQSFDKATGILGFNKVDLATLHPYSLLQQITKSLKELDHVIVADMDQMDGEASLKERDAQAMVEGKAIWTHKLENETGFSFVLGQHLLFDPGQATITSKAYPVLEKLAQFMKYGLYTIYIDGHTDDAPMHTLHFPSNEALSLARAEAVMEYLVNACGVHPKLFALAGYGSSHPLMSGATPARKAANRRVELIFRRNPK